MTHEEKIAAWKKSGELKVSNGKVTGTKIPMLHVGTPDTVIKGVRIEGIPPKMDVNGLPALELHSRKKAHQENLRSLGWKPYTLSEPPKGVERKTRKTATKKAE